MKDIKKLVREHLSIIDETPLTNKYEITYRNRKVGFIEVGDCQCGLGKDTLQIFDIEMSEEYRNIKLAIDSIHALWLTYPDINKFVISPPQESLEFWEKVGFSGLNDNYLMLLRGH